MWPAGCGRVCSRSEQKEGTLQIRNGATPGSLLSTASGKNSFQLAQTPPTTMQREQGAEGDSFGPSTWFGGENLEKQTWVAK